MIDLLTLDAVAGLLGVAKSTASVRVRESMRHFRDGDIVRVPRAEVLRYIESRMVEPMAAPELSRGKRAPKKSSRGGSEPVSALRLTMPRRKTGT